MRHPMELVVSRDYRRHALLALLALSAVLLAARWYLGRELLSADAPHGLLSLELAGEPIIVNAQVAHWSTDVPKADLQMSVGLDYAFLLCWSTAMALACMWAGRTRGGSTWIRVALLLAWAYWLAAAIGALENVLLVRLLANSLVNNPFLTPDLSIAGTIRVLAIVKYAVFELGLLYLVASGSSSILASLVSRRRLAPTAS